MKFLFQASIPNPLNNQVWVVDTTVTTADVEEAPVMETSDTTEVVEGKAPAVDKGKAKAAVKDEPTPKKRKATIKCSTPDKAFDVEE
ncbi:hypothetical protein Tco_1358723, partial [Tanacetum coccineum]